MNVASSISREERILSHLLAFGELMKPELTGLSVLTALFGLYLASGGGADLSAYLLLGAATLLVGGGAGALNQWIEKDLDVLMKRTERRPLPSGRVDARAAMIFGIATTVLGNALLLLSFGVLSGILGILTSVLYLFVYTPLKRRTWHNTTVGAIPGALPVLIGWASAGGPITEAAWILFAIVFLWQFPHFLSLAWLYRKDYAKAGFQMLSVIDNENGLRTARLNLVLSVILAAATVGLAEFQDLGSVYAAGAVAANLLLCWTAFQSFRMTREHPSQLARVNRSARHLFFASLAYLPLLMGSAVISVR